MLFLPRHGSVKSQLRLAQIPRHLDRILYTNLFHLRVRTFNRNVCHVRLSCPVFTILSHLALLHDFPPFVLHLGGISAFQLSLVHFNLILYLLIRLLNCLNLEQVFHPFN